MKTLISLLEVDQILEQISRFSRTALGKKKVLDGTFIDEAILTERLKLCDEMLSLLIRFGSLPIEGSDDLLPTIDIIEKDGVLSIEGIYRLGRESLSVLKLQNDGKKHAGTYPNLAQRLKALEDVTAAFIPLMTWIHPSMSLLDGASDKLLSIRTKLKAIDGKLLELIQAAVGSHRNYLSEVTFTIKNGHYVLPVVTQQKQQVDGVVQDISASGMTTFIEPLTVAKKANEKYALIQQEHEEVLAILKAWTSSLKPFVLPLRNNHLRLAELDEIHAKALFGQERQGAVAVLQKEPMIDLPAARHPLIDPNKVVANSFTLNKDKSLIIISGPNAGGKTIALKTVGLMVYLNQLAIPLLTSKPAHLSYFKHIYADIGDSQSVLENLSTFAGHIKNLVPLTDLVRPFDLVLIDELGTGTDPKEGEALAKSLLMHLQSKQAFVIVSSHFPGLKQLAFTQPHMINASMKFDEEKLEPTYQFVLGLPGKSYGLIMAKRYGLAPQVVAFAEKYIADAAGPSNLNAEKIQEQLLEAERIKGDAEALKKTLEEEKKILKQKQAEYQLKLTAMKEESEKTKRMLIRETEEKIDAVIKDLANPNLKLHEAIALKKTLEGQTVAPAVLEAQEALAIGDYVTETQSGLSGKIVDIRKQNITFRSSDGLTLRAKALDLVKIQPPKMSGNPSTSSVIKSSTVSASLNIIGLHIDEAKDALERYFDAVRLTSFKQVKVIHGFGSGALKNLTADFLRTKSYVEKFVLGDGQTTGFGVTTVYLK